MLFISASCFFCCRQPDPASPVTDLNMFNWDEMTEGKATLVMFYGPR